MPVVTEASEEVQLHALIANARANGWTVSYERNSGQVVGIARRGKVFLETAGESVVEALWRVLEKTNHFPIGDV